SIYSYPSVLLTAKFESKYGSVSVNSHEYNAVWINFYDAVGVDYSPILAFFTTLQLLYRLWKHHYSTTSIQKSEEVHLTYNEQNAVWYVAGYIIRKLRKTQNVNEEQLALFDFFVDDSADVKNTDDDSSPHEEIKDTQSGLRMVDRGGLTNCSNNFNIYLRALEMSCKIELEQSFNQPEARHRDFQLLAEAIMKDTDVQSNWKSLVQCHEKSRWRQEPAATLETDIIKLLKNTLLRIHKKDSRALQTSQQPVLG
uniref:Uncharacterized protein n=1 Tax=Amphimedon queenslandica TaxID=400682 RepID=A0A1X7V571_AMPQE